MCRTETGIKDGCGEMKRWRRKVNKDVGQINTESWARSAG